MAQRPHLKIGLTTGVNYSELRTDGGSQVKGAYQGFHAGGYFRVANPGMYYEFGINFIKKRRGGEYSGADESYKYERVKLNFFEIPLLLGYHLVNNPAFKWRIYSGVNSTFNGAVIEDNAVGFGKSDYLSPNIGLRLGTGVDIAFMTIDLNSTFSIGKVLDGTTASQLNFFKFDIGVIL